MISNKVEMRELVTLSGNGVLLHGTYHKPPSEAANGATGLTKNLGVMFLNALSSPRSLVGDSGVYWATQFAANGYPAFRFDLPGLGDSYGEIPNDLLRFTNEGGYAAVASAKTKELVNSRGLSGVVMFGHCAGATTAIYAAAGCSGECKGLILMDPYFNLPKALTSSLSPELVNWARRSRLGAVIRAAYDRLREARGALCKAALPPNANFSLISRLKQVLANGVPILILRAHQPAVLGEATLRAGNFDYFAYIQSLAVRSNQFSIRELDGTDHSFANSEGRLAVWQHTEKWLRELFPQATAPSPLFENQDFQVHERKPVVFGTRVPAHVTSGE
jgi:pimeloyl-ACP methyl ester carboxylesterase